jgi:hypothetical protein
MAMSTRHPHRHATTLAAGANRAVNTPQEPCAGAARLFDARPDSRPAGEKRLTEGAESFFQGRSPRAVYTDVRSLY